METQISQKRNLSVDIIKSFAIYGVIIIHISMFGFDNSFFSANWLATLVYDGLSRASVPLFFMCSGALLLNPAHELTLKKLYSRNILHIVIAMLFWATFYKLFRSNITWSSFIQAIKETFAFKQEYHFYYLHIILIVYMLLPVTRVFVKNASEKEMNYFLLFWFAFGIVYPTINTFWPFTLLTANAIPGQWAINMVYTSVGYGVLGWTLLQRKPNIKAGITTLVLGLLLVLIPTVYLSKIQGSLCQSFYEITSVGVCLMAFGIYSLCLHAEPIFSKKYSQKIVTELSKASFCIYLVHLEWLYIFRDMGFTINSYPCIISIPIYGIVILLVSYLTYLVLHQIPIVKKWLI